MTIFPDPTIAPSLPTTTATRVDGPPVAATTVEPTAPRPNLDVTLAPSQVRATARMRPTVAATEVDGLSAVMNQMAFRYECSSMFSVFSLSLCMNPTHSFVISLYSVLLRSPCVTNTFLALIIAPLLQTQAATGMGGPHVVPLRAASIVPRPSLGVRLQMSLQMNQLKATILEATRIHDFF